MGRVHVDVLTCAVGPRRCATRGKEGRLANCGSTVLYGTVSFSDACSSVDSADKMDGLSSFIL